MLENRLDLAKKAEQFPFMKNSIYNKIAVLLYFLQSIFYKLFFGINNKKIDTLFIVYSNKFFNDNNYYGSYSSYYLYEKTKQYGKNAYLVIPTISNLSFFYRIFFYKKNDILFFLLNPFLFSRNFFISFKKIKSNTLIKSNFILFFMSIYYASLEKYILKIKPINIFIESSTGYTDNFIIDICNKNNINIIFTPHGLGEMKYVEKESKNGYFTPTYYFSPYRNDKNLYGDKIINNNIGSVTNIINIGLVNWGFLIDDFINFKNINFLESDIYFLSQPLTEISNFGLNSYIIYLEKIKKIRGLVCKIHPRDNERIYKNIFGKNIEKIKPPFYGKLIKRGKVFITSCSTMGYEIIMSGKALVVYTPELIKNDIEIFGKYGVKVFSENSVEEMYIFIDKLLNDNDLYEKYVYTIKGEVEKEGITLDLDIINKKLDLFFKQ